MPTDKLVPRLPRRHFAVEPTPAESTPRFAGLRPRQSADEPVVLEYWRVLARRRKTVLAVTVAVLTLATIVSFLMKQRFTAESRISVGKENPDMLHLKDDRFPSLDVSEYNMELDAQVQILTSDTLLLENLRQLRGKRVEPVSDSVTDPASAVAPATKEEQKLLDQYGDYLLVSRIPHTPLIEIKFSDADPQFAADFVNSLVRVYIEQNFKTKYESARQVSGWLATQLGDLKVKTEVSQVKLAAFQRKNGILGIDDKQNIITQKLDDLNRELTGAQADRMQKQALYQATISGDLELLPGVSENPIIKHLKEQQAETANTYAKATADMGPAHPAVLQLNNQLKQIDNALQSEFKKIEERNHNAYIVAEHREAMLTAALNAQKEAANRLNERAVEYERLRHEVQENQQLYDSLSQRLKESGVSAGLRSGNVRVVDYARRPFAPSIPNIPLNLAAGLFLGCIGGATLAFIQERLDNRMHTAMQIEDVAALPLIGVVPRMPAPNAGFIGTNVLFGSKTESEESAILANPQHRGELVQSYRALCMSLFQDPQDSPQVIMITSSLPSEGKTTTSINCAIVLAQQGRQVLLVDADLRAPRIGQALGIQSSSGLTSILKEAPDTTDRQIIVPYSRVPNLFVLSAGPIQENSWELLDSPVLRRKISEWRRSYTHIIIDTPPVLAYSDALGLAPQVDSVVFTVFAGQTPRPAFLQARNLLMSVNANLTGIIVNGVDFNSSDYRAYGYYGYRRNQRSDTN
jgi:polysaccharide biosynthesis transport protein